MANPQPSRAFALWVIPVLALGAIVGVSMLLALFFGVVSVVDALSPSRGANEAATAQDDGGQPLVQGTASASEAESPIVCPDECYDSQSVRLLTMGDADFRKLGVAELAEVPPNFTPITVGSVYDRENEDWTSSEGSPDNCFFFQASAAYGSVMDAALSSDDDEVYYLGTHTGDRAAFADQSVRLFDSTEAASAYLAELQETIDGCSRVEIGPRDDRFTAAITPAPALDVPETIAAVGWVHTADPGTRWRAYVFDLQAANAVVRIRLVTDGAISEKRFRTAVETYMFQLELNKP
ncbi:hypothetical protein HDC94_002424 [Leifsonia sp. AK011]|uniref:hypothetical protein n=1 Tax=Leifsonia sp. AK011 TaxID=2723075 RepID=UPI0015CB187E|nr:hypothetical protein [Leifsonia sp. AK011]NYF11268.1 hypothetical protein [Leifsonia sp. AK011]